jgi:DNA-directed RNA polymerase subunit RPC12/RpoP
MEIKWKFSGEALPKPKSYICAVCSQETEQVSHGYGKTLCSQECFDKAKALFKPSTDKNRGGGIGKERVTI